MAVKNEMKSLVNPNKVATTSKQDYLSGYIATVVKPINACKVLNIAIHVYPALQLPESQFLSINFKDEDFAVTNHKNYIH